MTSPAILHIRDASIEQALPHVIFDGWSWEVIERGGALAGMPAEKVHAVFAGGLIDVVDGFADWADRQMMAKMSKLDPSSMRVRDRIRTGVLTRLEILKPYKEAERMAATFWAVPTRTPRAGKILWRTADRIWTWAGDTATDYNHYTKRGLLSGVLAATTMAWLDDENSDRVTGEFLDRRIEQVLQIGGLLGKASSRLRKAS